jgi:hypothetical protein
MSRVRRMHVMKGKYVTGAWYHLQKDQRMLKEAVDVLLIHFKFVTH